MDDHGAEKASECWWNCIHSETLFVGVIGGRLVGGGLVGGATVHKRNMTKMQKRKLDKQDRI